MRIGDLMESGQTEHQKFMDEVARILRGKTTRWGAEEYPVRLEDGGLVIVHPRVTKLGSRARGAVGYYGFRGAPDGSPGLSSARFSQNRPELAYEPDAGPLKMAGRWDDTDRESYRIDPKVFLKKLKAYVRKRDQLLSANKVTTSKDDSGIVIVYQGGIPKGVVLYDGDGREKGWMGSGGDYDEVLLAGAQGRQDQIDAIVRHNKVTGHDHIYEV